MKVKTIAVASLAFAAGCIVGFVVSGILFMTCNSSLDGYDPTDLNVEVRARDKNR